MNNNDLRMELKRQEEIFGEINKKIGIVLDKMDNIDEEYNELLDTKRKMKKNEIDKSKKYIVLGIILLIISSLIMIVFGGVLIASLSKTFEVFKMLLSLYCLFDGVLIALVGGYELRSFVKHTSDERYLCKNLDKTLEYYTLLDKIKDKEREIRYLSMEYESLVNERDDIELKIESLMLGGTGLDSKYDMMIDSIDDTMNYEHDRPLVRKRVMGNGSKDNDKKGEF